MDLYTTGLLIYIGAISFIILFFWIAILFEDSWWDHMVSRLTYCPVRGGHTHDFPRTGRCLHCNVEITKRTRLTRSSLND